MWEDWLKDLCLLRDRQLCHGKVKFKRTRIYRSGMGMERETTSLVTERSPPLLEARSGLVAPAGVMPALISIETT